MKIKFLADANFDQDIVLGVWRRQPLIEFDLLQHFIAERTDDPGVLAIAAQRGAVLVTHDVRKFFGLMLKKNGYVMEQVFSPLIVLTTPEHDELKTIAKHCLTKHHAHHYEGFFHTQWKLFDKELPRRVKPLLYAYRVLLTGIHLMRTGEVEANLVTLNDEFRLPQIPDLVAKKLAGPEQSTLPDDDVSFHEAECQRLLTQLDEASATSHLPEMPSGSAALNDLLVRARLGTSFAN